MTPGRKATWSLVLESYAERSVTTVSGYQRVVEESHDEYFSDRSRCKVGHPTGPIQYQAQVREDGYPSDSGHYQASKRPFIATSILNN
jgi:hypothetical protein